MTGRTGAQSQGPSGHPDQWWGHDLQPSMVRSRCPPWYSPFLLASSFVPCSEKIHLAVTEMASLFPKVGGAVCPWGVCGPQQTLSAPSA